MKYLLTILLTFCAFINLQAAQSGPGLPPLTRYNNEVKNYQLDYPTAWQRKDLQQLDLFLFAPLKTPEQEVPANINIISEKVGPEFTLDKFYTQSVTNLLKQLTDINIEKSGDINIDGTQAKWIQYKHRVMSVNLKVMQYFFMDDNILYLITMSAPVDDFDKFQPEFNTIMKSFHFMGRK